MPGNRPDEPRRPDRPPSLEEQGVRPEDCGIGHPHIDACILDTCRLIVQRIDNDPQRLRIGIDNLNDEEAMLGELSQASKEWRAILGRPWAQIRSILLAETDEGQRLRSSHPFHGLVTEEEGREILGHHPPPWAPPNWKPPPPPSKELMATLLADRTRHARRDHRQAQEESREVASPHAGELGFRPLELADEEHPCGSRPVHLGRQR